MTVQFSSNPYAAVYLSQLGLPSDLLQSQVAQLPAFALPGLHAAYLQALGASVLQQQGGQIPPALSMPSPGMVQSLMSQISGAGYAGGGVNTDMATWISMQNGTANTLTGWDPTVGDSWFHKLFSPSRTAAAKLERLLRTDDGFRVAWEQQMGVKIKDFGNEVDGKITLERLGNAAQPLPLIAANPAAATTYGMFQNMNNSVLSQTALLGLLGGGTGLLAGMATGSPFTGLALGGLGGIASSLLLGAGTGGVGGALGTMPFAFNMLNGAGTGSWNPLAAPGHINNTNPMYERMHQTQVASVLNDPSLSVEDKVMLMLSLIMKKMDDDIERQMNYINALQNQQANRQGKAGKMGGLGTVAGGVLGGAPGAMVGGQLGGKLGGGGQASPSVDVEMQKLQRMITKRAQMFEMMSNIMKKYDDTARAAIQKINQ